MIRPFVFCMIPIVLSVALVAQDYNRSDYRHWTDDDGDCLNVRHEVLWEESQIPPSTNRNGCRVLGGEWHDPYSGQVFRFASDLDVDHVLPLAWVHERGGFAWSPERKEAYANYMEDPNHLVAVAAGLNRSKGARGPDEWVPPNEEVHCWYGATFARISFEWGLTLTARDKAGIAELLKTCR